MRELDWSQTPIGPVSTWPQSLKTAVRIILTSRYAMFVWWGRELVNLYNDPYRVIVGAKHPDALGKSARLVWAEIWDQIGPRTDAVLLRGESTYDEDLLLMMERHGYLEETYFTFSYSPLPDDSGKVGGLFCAVTEETQRIIGERRLALLREIAAVTAEARTPLQVCQSAAQSLSRARRDLPFSLIYLLDHDGKTLRKAGFAGIASDHPAAPDVVSLDDSAALIWPFRQVVETEQSVLVDRVHERVADLPTGEWGRSPKCTILAPIAKQGQTRPAGVLVAGLNPHRESRLEGLQAGADDYLVKPFTARELLARIGTHLKMARLRREAAEREAQLRAEAELERNRLKELLAQAPAAIGMMAGPEHRWTYVNDECVRMAGRKNAADFLGKTFRESLPELNPSFSELLDHVYRTGEPYVGREIEAVHECSSTGQPERGYFDFVYQPIKNSDGQVDGVLVHAVEVTDKVFAREAIEQSEERLRLAQTAAQIGTWEWDPERNTSSLSAELHRIFATDPDDPDHVHVWRNRVLPADWQKVQHCMDLGFQSGDMDFEYRYQHPEAGLRWLHYNSERTRSRRSRKLANKSHMAMCDRSAHHH